MENKITISSLSGALSQSTGKTKKLCDDFLKEFFKLASEILESGESLRVKGFGTFKVVEVDGRVGVNVNTGEKQEIAPFKKVVFSPAKEIASQINAPFEDFESVEIEDDLSDDIFIEEAEEDFKEESEEYANVEKAGANTVEGRQQKPIENEDDVTVPRLEEGSNEEGEDDEITYEAYTEVEQPTPDIAEYELKDEEEKVSPEGELKESSARKDENESEVPEKEIILPVYEEETEEPVKRRFGLGFLVGSLSTLLVCVVIFMLGCFFDWWPESFMTPNNIQKVAESEVPVDTRMIDETQPQEVVEETQAEPVYDTVSTTRYLTTIAREHYGNFNFWPYIYIENQEILGHPDRITPGTKVVVPDLSKYGVDPQNKEDVAVAKQKGAEIYAKYNK